MIFLNYIPLNTHSLVASKRHGPGKLTYAASDGFWLGNWKEDMQDGFHSWMKEGSVTPSRVVVFERDVRRLRTAMPEEITLYGWVCKCGFVVEKSEALCGFCKELKTSGLGTLQAIRELATCIIMG